MSIQLYKVAVCRNQQINTCNITYSDEDNDNDDDKSDKIKLTVKYCFNIKGATFIFTMTLTVVHSIILYRVVRKNRCYISANNV